MTLKPGVNEMFYYKKITRLLTKLNRAIFIRLYFCYVMIVIENLVIHSMINNASYLIIRNCSKI